MRGKETAIDRLTEVLERVLAAPQQPDRSSRDRFKTPTFDGKGDVVFFIRQFGDVAEANGWEPAAALIHLRAALTESATTSGQAETVEEIFNSLRARYGMTAREAKAKLATLRRDNRTSLQEHADEIKRLMNVAYADFPHPHKEDMSVDLFHTTLGNAYLQRHLLAVQATSLEAAVRAGNEYFQIQPSATVGSVVRQVEDEETGPIEAAQQVFSNPLEALMKAIMKLTEEVGTLNKNDWFVQRQAGIRESAERRCFREEHIQKNCSSKPLPVEYYFKKAGNGSGPQQ